MPLALMGCAAQIHKKAYKQVTWQYHSVDGWYLYTSPDHYCTHACHIKATREERLTDTVTFQHKRITNPTITHADKVMHAIQKVITEIKNWAALRIHKKHENYNSLSTVQLTTYSAQNCKSPCQFQG